MKYVLIVSFLFVFIQVFNVQAVKAGKYTTRKDSLSGSARLPGGWERKQKPLRKMDKKEWGRNNPDHFLVELHDALMALKAFQENKAM